MEALNKVDESAGIRALIDHKLRYDTSLFSDVKKHAKLVRFLISRGYPYVLIKKVCDEFASK
jgi:SOS response regulatory protein OraA/RecX